MINEKLSSFLQEKRKPRWELNIFDNKSQIFTVTLALIRGVQKEGGDPPPGYVKDTGVITAGINIQSGGTSETNVVPICAATYVECSLEYMTPRGQHRTLDLKPLIADPGRFFRKSYFAVGDSRTIFSSDSPFSVTVDFEQVDIPVVEFKPEELQIITTSEDGSTSIRSLEKEEIGFLKEKIAERIEEEDKKSEAQGIETFDITWGRVANHSPYKTGVYGPKLPQDRTDNHNTLYVMPGYKKTPSGWDADGIFVPNDVSVKVEGRTYKGHLAVKVFDIHRLSVSGSYHERQTLGEASIPGAPRKPLEVKRPGDVKWYIPDVSQSVIDSNK